MPLTNIRCGIAENVCVKNREITAGSRILEGFKPPYSATIVEKLESAGVNINSILKIDEFMSNTKTIIDEIKSVKNENDFYIISDNKCEAGEIAESLGMYAYRPSYGLVSRFGLITKTSSIETAAIIAKDLKMIPEILNAIAGNDPKDAMSVQVKLNDFTLTDIMADKLDTPVNTDLDSLNYLKYAKSVHYILRCAEGASNLSKYDGIRYGRRSPDASTPVDIFEKSRAEGFGHEIKKMTMLGIYFVSAEEYKNYYEPAMKIRTLIINELNELLEKSGYLSLEFYSDSPIRHALTLAGLPAIIGQSDSNSGKYKMIIGKRGNGLC